MFAVYDNDREKLMIKTVAAHTHHHFMAIIQVNLR